MNINLLNNLIKGVAEQIPLVHSFYTNSPYESWNIKEVKYGSVSFVVTKTITREQTTTYNAVLYYADRLTENNSNRDSLHSDAATVIQTIVGALNQSDDYITVDYPVEITLFEQSFCDDLCGGYANVVITVEGMGECFNDEFTVPDIVATSAYYTKDEILELFPLRTQLAKVATTGSFNDLLDTPDLVTLPQHNQLIDDLNNIRTQLDGCVDEQEYNNLLAEQNRLQTELNDKVGSQQYNQIKSDIEFVNNQLSDKVGSQQYNQILSDLKDIQTRLEASVDEQEYNQLLEEQNRLRIELSEKIGLQQYNQIVNDVNALKTALDSYVDEQEYNNVINRVKTIETSLNDKLSLQSFKQFAEGQNTININLALELLNKVNTVYFETTVASLQSDIDNRVTTQGFATFKETYNANNAALTEQVANKVDSGYFEAWADRIEAQLAQLPNFEQILTDIQNIKTDLSTRPTQQSFDNLYEAVEINLVNLATEVGNKVGNEEYQLFKATTNNTLKTKVDKQIFDNHVVNMNTLFAALQGTVEGKVDDTYFDEWKNGIEAEISERVTVQGFANYAANVYTKEEIENRLANYEYYVEQYLTSPEFEEYLNNFVTEFTEEYLETALDYYTKSEMDEILSNLRLEDYYTKEEIATLIDGLELENYYKKSETYNKTEVDEAIANVEVDLSGYYTKTEVNDTLSNYYTKTEVDTTLSNNLDNYYTKSETFNKSEVNTFINQINSTIGDIDSILNNVLYVM